MKWPIGAGFSMSAFPVRLTAQGFSLLAAHDRTADGLESFPPRRRASSVMHRKQVKSSKLPDSMKVEQRLPPSKDPFDQSDPSLSGMTTPPATGKLLIPAWRAAERLAGAGSRVTLTARTEDQDAPETPITIGSQLI